MTTFSNINAQSPHESNLLLFRFLEIAQNRGDAGWHILAAKSGNVVPSSGKCIVPTTAVFHRGQCPEEVKADPRQPHRGQYGPDAQVRQVHCLICLFTLSLTGVGYHKTN